jgi:hypothetical protein
MKENNSVYWKEWEDYWSVDIETLSILGKDQNPRCLYQFMWLEISSLHRNRKERVEYPMEWMEAPMWKDWSEGREKKKQQS